MTHTRRRASAAAARALRERNRGQDPTSLPEELEELARAFRPQVPLADGWDTVGSVVLESLRRSQVRGPDSFRKHLTHLGYFYLWATRQDLAVATGTLTRAHVDEYTRTGMPGSSDKSRADRRARLRNIADQLNPDPARNRGPAISGPPIRPPYADDELYRLVRVADIQPTVEQSRRVALCVGLGAGAGLDSPDLRHLHVKDIEGTGSGITVHVVGARPRSVPVLASMEALVLRGLRDLDPTDLVLGRVEDRRNIAASALADVVTLGGCPRIEQTRLRSTWLAHHLAAGTPLTVLLPAAGLRTARTLPDLLPHLPTVPTATAHALLRDAQAGA